jgi:hypothetical protein
MDLGVYEPLFVRGAGVATVSASGGGTQLKGLRLAGGLVGHDVVPLTDPQVAGTYPSVRVYPQLGTGTLSPFWPVEPPPEPQLVDDTLLVGGTVHLCVLTSGCSSAMVLPLSGERGETGVGVGGLLTAGGFGIARVSILAAPWTVFTASLVVDTIRGGTTVWTKVGWIHGPASFSSTAAQAGGALQLVTPLEIQGSPGPYLPSFVSLTFEFLPEPGSLPLVVAGIAGLIALGSNRIQP